MRSIENPCLRIAVRIDTEDHGSTIRTSIRSHASKKQMPQPYEIVMSQKQ